MFGGPPIFMPQQMPPGMPPQGAAPMQRQGIPPHMQAGNYVPPRLKPPNPSRPVPAQPIPRVARGARPSEAPAGSVAIPTPEELGITRARSLAPSLDWSATRSQLSELGITRFEVEPLANGGARFSCWLGGTKVYADGASEAEAVRLCLDRARSHVTNRR